MNLAVEGAWYLAQAIVCILVADLLSGFFHWLEDAYGRPEWPITGVLITSPNILHHRDPGYFTHHSWLRSADVLLGLGAAVLLVVWLGDALDWHAWLVVAVGVNANEIHKWAHRSRARNPALVTFLQDVGLLQTPAHHAEHHRAGKDTHYCVITNYLNPVLDRIRLWSGLEALVRFVFGVRRRPDASLTPPQPA